MKNKIYWIDLFCGGGGTTSGIHLVGNDTQVLACVNHDKNAIESHKANHPDALHFTEDIRDLRVIDKLKNLVYNIRKKEPNCTINLWASLECTNFSIAKGGLPRDPDSRSLADHMKYYIEALDPDYFYVENVREFLMWGPLNKEGKPINGKKEIYYKEWEKHIESYGYIVEKRILNSADFGSYQSRKRLFIIFTKPIFCIPWPTPTHSEKDISLKPWKPVKEILDLEDKGSSIFTRSKPLAENTLKRILAGLEKFVPQKEYVFSKTYNSGSDGTRCKSLETAINTITTANTHSLVFVSNFKSGHPRSKNHSIEQPIGTISTVPTQSLVSLQTYYGKGGIKTVEVPSSTVTTKDRLYLVEYKFLDQQYSASLPINIDRPCNSLTTVPKFSIVNITQFLFNPQYKDTGRSIDRPCFTLIARMDKTPPSIISVDEGNFTISITDNDTEAMIKIKEFMCANGVVDIKMRMLKIPELKQIQGFPRDYKLIGTQAEQKKYIGNAVEVNMAKSLAAANTKSIQLIKSSQKTAS
ncbi:hypothetical protein HMPREF9711_03147 [Myroides odoratimimus CCUG 3837]|uniref:DNA cytosine methyltransferase n=1 Tax=Myroides odoratimimus TaxID=76832 RepID=UPI000280ACF2|nr:DNA cytosine methyltransferase [Myroides odoratimimus]EKB02362.1 hypothetical protein HMPREF9711_03147 [Myroides odoratimimus CCUG 3837]